ALRTLGAALYRAGQPEKAARALHEAMEAHRNEGVPEDWLFLALAHHRLGQAGAAQLWYRRAAEAIRQVDTASSLPDGRILSWQIRVDLHLLLQEAATALGEKLP